MALVGIVARRSELHLGLAEVCSENGGSTSGLESEGRFSQGLAASPESVSRAPRTSGVESGGQEANSSTGGRPSLGAAPGWPPASVLLRALALGL